MSVIKRVYAELTSVAPATPVIGDLSVVETADMSVVPYGGERKTKNIDHAGTESQEKYTVDENSVYDFSLYLASSGTAGTAPEWGKFLMACGMDETIVAVTSVSYTIPADPVDLYTPESLHIWRFVPSVGKLQKTENANGQAQIELKAGEKSMIKISNMMGDYNTPTAGSPPSSPVYSSWKQAHNFVADNLPVMTVDGYSACVSEVTIPLGVAASRSTTTCQGTVLEAVDAEGTITFIEPNIATKDFYSKFESHETVTPVDITIQIGDTAGAIVEVMSTSVQLYDYTETEIDGKPAFQVSCVWLIKPTVVAR